MNRLHRTILAAGLWASLLAPLAAIAQAPPPVPALPDTERRTSYSLTATTCACSVGFQIYGDSTDVDAWIEVWVAGTRYLSTDPNFGWSLSSATGSLATIPRPITDAVLTFNAAQSGVVQIVGARRPRRVSQFSENRGVAARDLNQALTDLVAQNRETWDKINDVTGRGLFSAPGNILGTLPAPNVCAGAYLAFDPTGLIPLCNQITAGGVGIATPTVTVPGNVVTWGDLVGKTLSAGFPSAGIDANVLNTKIANYTVGPTDCNKTIQLGTGSTGLFTLTVPAVSGFAATCSVFVVNSDTARGKAIAGLTGVTKLYPLQTLGLKIVNGAWVITKSPGRWRVTGSATLFIDASSGNDANDCLASGAGACATSTQAVSDLALNIENDGFFTIQYATATYTNKPFVAKPYLGTGTVLVQGDSGANTVMTCTASCGGTNQAVFDLTGNAVNSGVGGTWIISGFNITSSGSGNAGIMVAGATTSLQFNLINFGALSGTAAHISCIYGSHIDQTDIFEISGGATFHLEALDGCTIHERTGSATVAIINSPTFTTFAFAQAYGVIGIAAGIFSGGNTVTGVKCNAVNANIDTGGSSATLPGSSTCTTSSGGQVF